MPHILAPKDIGVTGIWTAAVSTWELFFAITFYSYPILKVMLVLLLETILIKFAVKM